MLLERDTIAAVSTAMAPSGIGIVRISGAEAFAVAGRVFSGKKKIPVDQMKSHTIHYGHIRDKGEVIDEVLLMVMKAPHTYTGEDTVEIDCHGGILAVSRVLDLVVACGARLAGPGEFTKRAFLSGRIDLSQAEAVMDVIEAKNENALKASMRQLKGSVSKKIDALRASILYEVAYIESALDDPEHIDLTGYGEHLHGVAKQILSQTEALLASADAGMRIKEGIKTVIVGKPNVGKSSLLNLLVGQEKAIVTDIAGTTRDVVEEDISIGGVTLRLLDTAGIRETEDKVERIGVARAREHAGDADLILYVVDTSVPLDTDDEAIVGFVDRKKTIVLCNKSDLEPVVTKEMIRKKIDAPILFISAKDGSGTDALAAMIKEMFFSGAVSFNEEVCITNARHKEALAEAAESLRLVLKGIALGMPEDFFTIDLMNAYEALGHIIGASVGEDLVNEIFGKFCTGK